MNRYSIFMISVVVSVFGVFTYNLLNRHPSIPSSPSECEGWAKNRVEDTMRIEIMASSYEELKYTMELVFDSIDSNGTTSYRRVDCNFYGLTPDNTAAHRAILTEQAKVIAERDCRVAVFQKEFDQ